MLRLGRVVFAFVPGVGVSVMDGSSVLLVLVSLMLMLDHFDPLQSTRPPTIRSRGKREEGISQTKPPRYTHSPLRLLSRSPSRRRPIISAVLSSFPTSLQPHRTVRATESI
jgi:hypothetical protein